MTPISGLDLCNKFTYFRMQLLVLLSWWTCFHILPEPILTFMFCLYSVTLKHSGRNVVIISTSKEMIVEQMSSHHHHHYHHHHHHHNAVSADGHVAVGSTTYYPRNEMNYVNYNCKIFFPFNISLAHRGMESPNSV